MKRVLLTPLVFMVAMVSCEKDIPVSEAIIGKWDVVSISQVTYRNNLKKNDTNYYFYSDEMGIQFASGGTGIFFENGDVYGTFTWTLSGNTLTIPGDTPIVWDITADKKTLVWSYSESEVTDTVTYKYQYIYTAQKVN